MTQLIDEAVDALERRVFFDQLSASYETLRVDPAAWSEIEFERILESRALRDRSSRTPAVAVAAQASFPCHR